MPNYWNQSGIPHKGWELINVIDIRLDGQSELETDYETCMMCGNEKIRYVHIVEHYDVDKEFRVGCRCAEKMTDDYVNPKRRERELRNRVSRRANWENREWKISENGNYYIKVGGHHLLIYRDKKTKNFKIKIGERFGKKLYPYLSDAKIAVFNGVEYLKEKGEW